MIDLHMMHIIPALLLGGIIGIIGISVFGAWPIMRPDNDIAVAAP